MGKRYLVHFVHFNPVLACAEAVDLAVDGEVDVGGGEQLLLVLHQPDGGEGEGGDWQGGEEVLEDVWRQEEQVEVTLLLRALHHLVPGACVRDHPQPPQQFACTSHKAFLFNQSQSFCIIGFIMIR